jgi:60S ribosome subunit biogenesis protein NIP7
VWLKPAGEMPFLYGNHIIKGHVGRVTDDTPEHVGVIVYNMADVPLGFGVSAKSSTEQRRMEPTGIAVFHQSDAGEYLRLEDSLF